jgi:hypothetical protein
MAVGELIFDKLPFVPKRIDALPLMASFRSHPGKKSMKPGLAAPNSGAVKRQAKRLSYRNKSVVYRVIAARL